MEKETRHCQVYQEILKIFFRERHTLKAKFNMVQYSLSNRARGYVGRASVKKIGGMEKKTALAYGKSKGDDKILSNYYPFDFTIGGVEFHSVFTREPPFKPRRPLTLFKKFL